MESWRPRSPDTSSSDEEDQERDHESGTIPTAKRSYECTFCKRGFTNAQALGGHMNIHRKDRAKAKQLISSGTSSLHSNHYSNEDQYRSMITSHHHHDFSSAPISSPGATSYYPVWDRKNYQMYFQQSGPSPGYGYDHDGSIVSRSSLQSSGANQELWGANLSLRFGTSHLEDDDYRRGVRTHDEVDLELRLGHA